MELDLELLKKDWNTHPQDFKQYSKEELFQMTKKASVSVAKWVFIIGVSEILFWVVLGVILEQYLGKEEQLSEDFFDTIVDISDIFSQILPFAFLGCLLYLNYQIRSEETPKKLMRNILLMKKVILWYIGLFLGQVIFLVLMVIGYKMFQNYQQDYLTGQHSLGVFLIANAFGIALVLIFFVPLIFLLKWIYKKLIYGKMLRKLKENYAELSQMEE